MTWLEDSWCLCPVSKGSVRPSQWDGSVNGAAIGKQGLQERENSKSTLCLGVGSHPLYLPQLSTWKRCEQVPCAAHRGPEEPPRQPPSSSVSSRGLALGLTPLSSAKAVNSLSRALDSGGFTAAADSSKCSAAWKPMTQGGCGIHLPEQ